MLTITGSNWAALAFDPADGGMKEADMVIVSAEEGMAPVVGDYWSDTYRKPQKDTAKTAGDQVAMHDYRQERVGTKVVTTILISRPLKATDAQSDRDIPTWKGSGSNVVSVVGKCAVDHSLA
jgi:hypothetical protein